MPSMVESFKMLFVVPTPIGNLKDITLRALKTLESVDGIICEDSRRTSILLNHYRIKKPLVVLNDYNEKAQLPHLLKRLKQGENLALVSDAGTPLISDPGYKLVRESLAINIGVDALPGPSSILPALILSGLPPDKFMLLGYLPEKPGHRKALLQKISSLQKLLSLTYVIFVAPHKLTRTLSDIKNEFGNIDITLAQELTKIHQKVDRMPVEDWIKKLQTHKPKGEYVLLFYI